MVQTRIKCSVAIIGYLIMEAVVHALSAAGLNNRASVVQVKLSIAITGKNLKSCPANGISSVISVPCIPISAQSPSHSGRFQKECIKYIYKDSSLNIPGTFFPSKIGLYT